MERINCRIEYILFPKAGQPQPENGYAIVSARVHGGKQNITLKGSMPGVHAGAEASVSGDWKTDNWGQSFVVKTYEEKMPKSLDGIRNYLSSGLIRGIGPAFAALIVNKFGEDTLDIIDNNPDRLNEVPGIGKKKAASIIESWKEQKGIRDVMVFLKTYEVGNAVSAKIYRKYRDRSIQVIKENPYVLADEIDGVGFLTADRIALSMGHERGSGGRIRSAVLYAMNEGSNTKGHVYHLREDLIKDALELLNNAAGNDDETVEADDVDRCLELMCRDRDVICEGLTSERIYLPLFFNAEKKAAERLSFLCGQEDRRKMKDIDFRKLEEKCGVEFEDVQRDAITLASGSHVCVITGGPGTGKTTTMKGVIQNALRNKLKVLLAAPTGRAAKRLAETTGMDASTIHRMLEYRPGEGFGRNEDEPLAGDLLVVDESSMIDTLLVCSLLKAVPDNMSVVFVGDVDQLPSVGAGNVLRDMIGSGVIPVVRLTKIFRQAADSLIVWNAHAIDEGRAPSLPCNLSPDGEDFCFIERDSTEKIQNDILTLVPQYIPEMFGIRKSDIQVLSPMRRGPLGTEELNRLLQDKLNPSRVMLKRGLTEFRLGDRVMQTKNNYEWDVFNGDIGRIVRVDTEERTLTIDFDGNLVEAKGDEMDSLDLAYACTIHKSQGSEYPVVVIPVTMGHYVMLQRNLLYTAITRAKKRCVLVGEKKAIMTMIGNNAVKKRNSALSEKLQGLLKV